MKNIRNENLKLFFNNYYTGNLRIKWKLAPIGKAKHKFYCGQMSKEIIPPLYKAKFYNPNNKNKIYHITLYMLFINRDGESKLYIQGNLSEWFYQVALGRELSSEEYDECLRILLCMLGDVDVVEEYIDVFDDAIYDEDEDGEVYDGDGNSQEFNNILMCIDKHKKYKSKRRANFDDDDDDDDDDDYEDYKDYEDDEDDEENDS